MKIFYQLIYQLKRVSKGQEEVVCMAYGNISAFVLSSNSMLTFIVRLQTWRTFMLTGIRWEVE